MRHAIFLACMAAGWLWAQEMLWRTDLKAALEEAKRTHKPLAVLIEGRYCRWCKKLDKEVLQDRDVTARLKAYIPVRIDQNDARALSLLPSIRGVPTVFFLSSDRRVLTEVLGYYDKKGFLSFFDEAERAMKVKTSAKTTRTDANVTLRWHTSVDEAFAQAKRESKHVLVMVEDVDCRWCKKVKRESLSRPDVKQALRPFVLLKISRSSEEMQRLPELHGPIPSFHLFSPQKEPLDAIYGYFDAAYLKEYFERLSEEL